MHAPFLTLAAICFVLPNVFGDGSLGVGMGLSLGGLRGEVSFGNLRGSVSLGGSTEGLHCIMSVVAVASVLRSLMPPREKYLDVVFRLAGDNALWASFLDFTCCGGNDF